MAKISVIGICGNSIFLTLDQFHKPGETAVATNCFEEIGGKGINQAIAAARMGAEVSFLVAVGDDVHGNTCIAAMQAEGIDGHFAVKPGQKTTFACILTDRSGENRVTVYRGAELCVEDVLAFEEQIAASDILLLQQEVPPEVNETAITIAARHEVKVILNPAPVRPFPDELASQIYLATPNEHEQESIGHLPFQNRVVTLGEKGCLLNSTEAIPAVPAEAVDTTGAGDTFNGVLAACLAEGMALVDACRYGVAAAGISVTRHGVLAAIPARNEIERMM